MVVLPLRRLQATYLGGFCNGAYTTMRLLLSNGVVMEKTAVSNVSEFEAQARKAISQAIEICQSRIEANDCSITPELKVLSNAVVSLEHSVRAFIAAEQLTK